MADTQLLADKGPILEKHCPSMSRLYLDKQGVAFRDRIYLAMEEYKVAGATEYAIKLHQANQEIEELRRRLIISEAACSALNEQETEARDLLRIFISRHEAGLLPDRFIYNDIKSFLDGQK